MTNPIIASTAKYDTVRHITTTDQAKLLRQVLRKTFPQVKLSVSKSRGSAINVYVPKTVSDADYARIKEISGGFEGGGFDGMIDLGYSIYSWLTKDGLATPAFSKGTGGSGGVVDSFEHPAPTDDAELVSFSATYVFVSKAYT